MISDAIIRTITRWLPTLDEARLRRVEAKVLEEALAQQDEQFSAPADTIVHRDGERTHGGNLSAAGRHGARRDDATPLDPGHETPTGGISLGCSIERCGWANSEAGTFAPPLTICNRSDFDAGYLAREISVHDWLQAQRATHSEPQ